MTDATPAAILPRRLLAVSHTGLFSGAERVLERYLTMAAAQGWQVRCATPEGPLAQKMRNAGIEIVPVVELKLPGGRRTVAGVRLLGRWARATSTLRRAAAEADVVVVNSVLALPALRLARPAVPVCWLVHDVLVRRGLQVVARLGAPVVDLAVGVSHAAASHPASIGLPTAVVWNGAPWPAEAAPSSAPRPRVVGINAMITSWKGQHVLLEAASALPEDVVIEVMGGTFPKDEPYRAELEARAARPDLAGRVRFLGHVEDPLAQMRTWSVAVSASVDPEAGPLAVLEAMSIGLAVVATAHGGATEVLDDAGLLVPPHDAPAMAAAIRRLLDDEAMRRRCGAVGRELVRERYTVDRSGKAFLALVAGLVAGEVAGPRRPADAERAA